MALKPIPASHGFYHLLSHLPTCMFLGSLYGKQYGQAAGFIVFCFHYEIKSDMQQINKQTSFSGQNNGIFRVIYFTLILF